MITCTDMTPLRQYGELRTKLTELAANGAYSKEFITQSDWFHTAEGMRAFLLMGLSEPNNDVYRDRSRRFANMYTGDDPEAPNYDPVNKVIKSIWNGSKGPMMHKATTYDWVGDPVPGTFHLLHNPAGRGKLLDLEANYKKMLPIAKSIWTASATTSSISPPRSLDSMPTCSPAKRNTEPGFSTTS